MTEEVIAFDTETDLIGPKDIWPEMICISYTNGLASALLGQGDKIDLKDACEELFNPRNSTILVGCKTSFDCGVIGKYYPELIPNIFRKYAREEIQDIKIREQLYNLATIGSTSMDKGGPLLYDLGTLAYKHMGYDLSTVKAGDNIWRFRYRELKGVAADHYPYDAYDYAVQDAELTWGVYDAQEEYKENFEHNLYAVSGFRAAADYMLNWITNYGMLVDPAMRARIKQMIAEELHPNKLNLLIEQGILIPHRSAVPYVKQTELAVAWLEEWSKDFERDFREAINKGLLTEEEIAYLESKNVDMKNPTKPVIKRKKFGERVVELTRKAGIFDWYLTDSGQPSTKDDHLIEIAHLDPMIEQFVHRAKLQKIATTELPRMEAPEGIPIRPNFKVLVNTGRTSSSAGVKKGQEPLYPGFNGQNVDPRVKPCYIPRKGNVFLSVDYSSLELVSFAKVQLDLFGTSVLAKLINAGVDPHAYLAATLAYTEEEEFQKYYENYLEKERIDDSYIHRYIAFDAWKEVNPKRFKHLRTLAKPIGLGYPGGLGADTMVAFAAGTYGVNMLPQQAKEYKQIWLDMFPETVDYFNHINYDCKDINSGMDLEAGDKYRYFSPLGMLRSKCSYTACCNGKALQTPSAEGALFAGFNVIRECEDSSQNSILYGCFGVNFVHDEYILEIPEDEKMHERACRVQDIMVDSMTLLMEGVKVKTEATLMRRWDKAAEPTYDENNRLIITEIDYDV